MAISKTEGCNKMVCSNCGQYFCYRCNKAITFYEHFREGSCNLFPDDEWNELQAIGQIQAQLFAQHGEFLQPGQLCPKCSQFNVKMGNNNHLFFLGMLSTFLLPLQGSGEAEAKCSALWTKWLQAVHR